MRRNEEPPTPKRCQLCGLGPHRYMFPADGNNHTPTAVACANSIIGLIEDLLSEDCPRALSSAITNMAYQIGRTRAKQ